MQFESWIGGVCAGGILVALIATSIAIGWARKSRARLERHLQWHDMEAANRAKATQAIDETLSSLDMMFPAKQPVKKPAAKKAATKKGGKKT